MKHPEEIPKHHFPYDFIYIEMRCVPLPRIFPILPMMLGKKRASRMLLMTCTPKIRGSSSFFRPNARKPSPNPVKKVLFP